MSFSKLIHYHFHFAPVELSSGVVNVSNPCFFVNVERSTKNVCSREDCKNAEK